MLLDAVTLEVPKHGRMTDVSEFLRVREPRGLREVRFESLAIPEQYQSYDNNSDV